MDIFFSTPSPSNYPDRIQASWVAACMLFHIQSMNTNTFHFDQLILKTGKAFLSSDESFGCCLYPRISLIDHSCCPTAAICLADRGTAFLFALRSLLAGNEISLSYTSSCMIKF